MDPQEKLPPLFLGGRGWVREESGEASLSPTLGRVSEGAEPVPPSGGKDQGSSLKAPLCWGYPSPEVGR